MKDAGITAIHTSKFRRTKDTAKPLATALTLTPQEVGMSDPLALIGILREKHGDGKVLIVGHSDTVPEFLKALGHPKAPAIGDGDFDNLFVVVPGKVTRPHVIRLHYKR
ncbi:MAG: phosphoglycerate mutase family protein [Singulisphaera sp.]